jgi:hypothetical protein
MSTIYDNSTNRKKNMDLPNSIMYQTQTTVVADPTSMNPSSWHNGYNTALVSNREVNPKMMAEGKKVRVPEQNQPEVKKETKKLEARKLSLPPIQT